MQAGRRDIIDVDAELKSNLDEEFRGRPDPEPAHLVVDPHALDLVGGDCRDGGEVGRLDLRFKGVDFGVSHVFSVDLPKVVDGHSTVILACCFRHCW